MSLWVRETPWVFPTILVVHALGMGVLVGINVFVALRALGVVAVVPGALFDRFVPLIWTGFSASLLSGLVLLAGYPAKGLTNPVFYLKFALIGAAMWFAVRVRRALQNDVTPGSRRAGVVVLVLWAAAITSGRFLAYTHHVLLASHLF